MADNPDTPEQREYASPACLLHEVDPAYAGLIPPPADIAQWRRAERARLIAARLALDAATRAAHTQLITAGLDALIGDADGKVISAYWPFRGEPDLLAWLRARRAAGARIALPVVVRKRAPLVFRLWEAGSRLAHGVWNIPFPADGGAIRPDIVIAPVVGFDPGCYRLGYGGGFFDRTLAALPPATIAIGVGHAASMIPTIHPQRHDVPMHHIITEAERRSR